LLAAGLTALTGTLEGVFAGALVGTLAAIVFFGCGH